MEQETTNQTSTALSAGYKTDTEKKEFSLKALFEFVFKNATATEMVSGIDISKEFGLSNSVTWKILEHLVAQRLLVRVSNDPKSMYRDERDNYLNQFYELQTEGVGGVMHEADRRNITVGHIVAKQQ